MKLKLILLAFNILSITEIANAAPIQPITNGRLRLATSANTVNVRFGSDTS
jgi:hypothetical protein